MKINNINYSQNFGLKKTKKYLSVENELIQTAEKLGRKEDAQTMASGITRLLPDVTLDYYKSIDKFILKDKSGRYNIGFINRERPLETFAFLYTHLKKYEQGDKNEARPITKIRKYYF